MIRENTQTNAIRCALASQRAGVVVAGLSAVISMLALLAPSKATAAFPGENGRIAYHRDAGLDDSGVFTIRPDGSQPQRLIPGVQPSWSPNGERLAFVSISNIFVANVDGGGVRQVVDSGYDIPAPAFSPSGNRIVFSGAPRTRRATGIWTIRTDGTGLRRIVGGIELDRPQYSPNGKRIVFDGAPRANKKAGIWTIRPSGTRLRRLTRDGADFAPDYSPDGRQIAFARGGTLSDTIRIMRADGSHRHVVPDTRGAGDPAYAPAGDRIVVTIYGGPFLGACGDLYTFSPTGADRKRLTQNCEHFPFDGPRALSPSWQPLPG